MRVNSLNGPIDTDHQFSQWIFFSTYWWVLQALATWLPFWLDEMEKVLLFIHFLIFFPWFFFSWDVQQIGGEVLSVRLKTPAWRAEIERELQLCSANTGALFNAFTNSLLGDDFSIPSMEFDMGDEGQGTLLQSFFVLVFCLNQCSTNDMKMISFKSSCVYCAFLISRFRKWMWLMYF